MRPPDSSVPIRTPSAREANAMTITWGVRAVMGWSGYSGTPEEPERARRLIVAFGTPFGQGQVSAATDRHLSMTGRHSNPVSWSLAVHFAAHPIDSFG